MVPNYGQGIRALAMMKHFPHGLLGWHMRMGCRRGSFFPSFCPVDISIVAIWIGKPAI